MSYHTLSSAALIQVAEISNSYMTLYMQSIVTFALSPHFRDIVAFVF